MKKWFIVGFGSIGRRIAGLALHEGASVVALSRKPVDFPGVLHVAADLDDPSSLVGLSLKGSYVVYLAPPPGGGFEEPRVRNFCASIPEGEEPAKVVYISTSAVYGDCAGAMVSEETPPNPGTSRGKRRLHGERLFLQWGKERGVPVVILRVTAIYAPDRLPVTQLTTGQPVLREEEALPTNRIHADDLARICLAAAKKGEAGDIFNVSDGTVGSMTQYFNAAADRLGVPRPRQVTLEEARRVMSPLMISYFTESRVVDNTKMLKKLGIQLLYPDLESGLNSPCC